MTAVFRPLALVLALAALACCSACGSTAADSQPRVTQRSQGVSSTRAAAIPACPRLTHVAPRANDGLPPLRLACLGNGPAVRLSDLRGKPLLLNVWAAWCTNCAEEAPLFQALHRRAGDRLAFFGVHYKAPRGPGLQLARDLGMFYPSVHDPDGDRTVQALHATAPPQTLFVTSDGVVAGRHIGVFTSQQQLDSLVTKYLGVSV